MSQRGEKYARAMERRVASLEDQMVRISGAMSKQEGRMNRAEELLEAIDMSAVRQSLDCDLLGAPVYSAELWPHQVMNADWEPAHGIQEDRRAERREARRKRTGRRRAVASFCMAALAIALLVIAAAKATTETGDGAAEVPDTPQAVMAITQDVAAAELDVWDGVGEDPLEAEKIEAALLAQGYFSDAVPLPYDLQDYMRTYCAEYGCPYPLALAVAEIESRFDVDAVGAIGESGIMQLNPGPGGSYHAALEEATGLDPTTPAGNIAAGCYLLGKYIAAYGDPAKAAMAYNMGEAGAGQAWAGGVTSTTYSAAVLEAMERWEVTVNAWNGI